MSGQEDKYMQYTPTSLPLIQLCLFSFYPQILKCQYRSDCYAIKKKACRPHLTSLSKKDRTIFRTLFLSTFICLLNLASLPQRSFFSFLARSMYGWRRKGRSRKVEKKEDEKKSRTRKFHYSPATQLFLQCFVFIQNKRNSEGTHRCHSGRIAWSIEM